LESRNFQRKNGQSEALPAFTFEERQFLIRRVIELDDPPLSEADETLVESRLAAHHLDPTSSLPLETLKDRLRTRTRE
jgi:hypothetical protein